MSSDLHYRHEEHLLTKSMLLQIYIYSDDSNKYCVVDFMWSYPWQCLSRQTDEPSGNNRV